MALAYGNTFTASDMKSLLEKNDKQQSGIRTWRQLFGNAALGFNAQSDALKTDYASAISEAYAANFKQNNAIMSAGLNIGATQDLLSQNRNDLHTAYQTYVQNYNSDLNTAMTDYQTEYTAINEDLTDRAQKFADLYDSAYKYLSEELSGAYTNWTSSEEYMQYLNDALVSGALTVDQVAAYMGTNQLTNRDYLTTYGLSNFMTVDADGNRTIKPWSQVSQSLFNNDGSLNVTGVEFFDQIFNATPQGYFVNDEDGNARSTRSFDKWLSDTNSELRDWYVSSDNYNYNLAGTNRGTANVLSGRESTDSKYHQSEYLTGIQRPIANSDIMNTDTYKSSFTKYKTFSDELEKINRAKANGDKYYTITDAAGVTVSKEIDDALNIVKTWQRDELNALNSSAKSTTTELEATYTAYQSGLKIKLGSQYYSELIQSSEYKNALKDFNDALHALQNDAYTPENINALSVKIDNSYKSLLDVVDKFVQQHKYTGKTSGF